MVNGADLSSGSDSVETTTGQRDEVAQPFDRRSDEERWVRIAWRESIA